MDQPGPGAREPCHEARRIPCTYLDAVVVALLEAHRLRPEQVHGRHDQKRAITFVPAHDGARDALPLIRPLRHSRFPLHCHDSMVT